MNIGIPGINRISRSKKIWIDLQTSAEVNHQMISLVPPEPRLSISTTQETLLLLMEQSNALAHELRYNLTHVMIPPIRREDIFEINRLSHDIARDILHLHASFLRFEIETPLLFIPEMIGKLKTALAEMELQITHLRNREISHCLSLNRNLKNICAGIRDGYDNALRELYIEKETFVEFIKVREILMLILRVSDKALAQANAFENILIKHIT